MKPIKLHAPRNRPPANNAQRDLYESLCAVVRGGVRFDAQSRGLYASDASNFHRPPLGVVTPLDADDVAETIEVCREHGVPIVSRGGGTGLAGQCLGTGVVLDHSRHFNRVLDVDPARRLARVEPGCVLDDLRERAREHGLTFGPDPATHNRCTLGGMIGNNSCGIHAIQSEFFGPGPRTEDNLESLDVLTYRGEHFRVGPTTETEYRRIVEAGGPRGDLYRRLRALIERHADAVRSGYPDIPRRVSGYNLPALLPENGFDVAAALSGSEGTLVTVLDARLKLIRRMPCRVLLVAGYPSVFAAADHIEEIRAYHPVGLEGIDHLLVEDIRQKGLHAETLDLLPVGRGFLFVEFGSDDREEARELAERCRRDLEKTAGAPSTEIITDPRQQAELWEIRESGLGATAFDAQNRASWPGWEDSAVPVDRLGDYLRALEKLYDRFDYRGALYGHFGQGCVHTRIDFDLSTREGIDRYRRFTREAAELVVSFGGSLSGEHGDGQQRSDLLPVMFSEELLTAFRELKEIWDPDGMMNPGRIVDPLRRDRDLRIDVQEQRRHPGTEFSFPEDDGDFYHTAMRCVGVGKCRRNGGGTMCPSYMVTGEEAHATRGRAHLLFEMVKGKVITDGWDSDAVKESLDLCLACKGCKADCPVGVDMATYKAEFLSHYYQRRLRPRQAYAFGLIHRWAPLGARAPRLSNFVTHAPLLSRVAKWLAGMAPAREVPSFARRTFRERFIPIAGDHGAPKVILWPDTFNNHFYPETLGAAAATLADAGCRVNIPRRRLCCGRALYDYGMLDTARDLWLEILETLEPEIDSGTPLVGVEPSCVAAFRDELPNLIADDPRARRLAEHTYTLEEYLIGELDYQPPRLDGKALFHGHCHGKSVMGVSADRELLDRIGLEVDAPETGCCGMAGSFGFESGDKHAVSVAAGERVLLPEVRRAAPSTVIVADGFSCRQQIGQLTDRRALHVAEVMVLAHGRARTGIERRPEDELSEEVRMPAAARWVLAAAAAAAVVVAVLTWW